MISFMFRAFITLVVTAILLFVLAGCSDSKDDVDYRQLDNENGTAVGVFPSWPGSDSTSGGLPVISRVTLSDGCFRLKEDGAVLVWPAGYTPDIRDGDFIIWQDEQRSLIATRAGRTVAVDGDFEEEISNVSELPESCQDGPFLFVHEAHNTAGG